jgi:hypothetical protein
MSINQVYHSWLKRIRELYPQERITRLRNLAWLISGLSQSRSVQLSKIANKIPGQATASSIVRRISRFLDNPAVRVRSWYEPIACHLIERVSQHQSEIRLIVDGSKVGFGHQLLIISLAYRRRALPLVWSWVKGPRGHSSSAVQLALLAYVRRFLPPECQVLLVGDSEFGAVAVLKQLDDWHWHYVLRQKSSHLVQLNDQSRWQPFGALISRMGLKLWLGSALLTQQWAYSVNLVAYWQVGEKEPWLLATNLPALPLTLAAYRRRMWIEQMFGDFKRHGFDLESTHLRHFRRLSRLTLAVALLYVWLVAYGSYIIKTGQRYLVDRSDRRDLSLFRIGFDMFERRLARALAVPISFSLYFT